MLQKLIRLIICSYVKLQCYLYNILNIIRKCAVINITFYRRAKPATLLSMCFQGSLFWTHTGLVYA